MYSRRWEATEGEGRDKWAGVAFTLAARPGMPNQLIMGAELCHSVFRVIYVGR